MMRLNYNKSSIISDGRSRARGSLSSLLFKIMIEPRAILSPVSSLSEYWTTLIWSKTRNQLTFFLVSTVGAAIPNKFVIKNSLRILKMSMQWKLWLSRDLYQIHQQLTPIGILPWTFIKIPLLRNFMSKRDCQIVHSLFNSFSRKFKLKLL